MSEVKIFSPAPSAIYPSLRGKRVLITGGATGIGEGLVRHFAAQQCAVSFVDIAEAEAAQLVQALAASDQPVNFHYCDLTDLASLDKTLQQIGPVDILINNAADDARHSLEEVTGDYWQHSIDVNLRHQLLCARAVAPHMKQQGNGSIINLGSISWHLGLPDLVVYETAKAGIEGMTRALARELGPHGIRVNCVVPGNIQTPKQMRWYTPESEAGIVAAQALKLRLTPDNVAAMVLFLAADDSAGCTGHKYWVDAGWR